MKRASASTFPKARRATTNRRSVCADYARFTHLKQAWIASHPAATSSEFDQAMRTLAKECRV